MEKLKFETTKPKKDHTVAVRLTRDEKQSVQDLAKEKGMTPSEYLRSLLKQNS